MAEYSSPVDIGNRTCQFCGVARVFSFADASDQAREIAFAYDKLRLAELQRNLWRFATKRAVLRPVDTTTLELVPAAWSATNLYVMGSIVAYSGLLYICQGWLVSGATTPDQSTSWVPYFGPLTITPYVAGASYFAGELVYFPVAENAVVYVALSNTSDTPGTFPPWSSTTIYSRGQSVTQVGPQLQFVPGDIPVFFTPGDLPMNVTSVAAQSLRDLNVGNPPLSGLPQWQNVPAASQPDYMTGLSWLRLDAAFQSIVIPYPLGSGPASDTSSQNVYRLPNGYLRHAPEQFNPNLVNSVSGIIVPGAGDLVFESVYIRSNEVQPLMLRFVADMTDVTAMDDLFCEGLAARIALDIGPVIIPEDSEHNQGAKRAALARVRSRYKDVIADARGVDAVERSASAPAASQYLSVRY